MGNDDNIAIDFMQLMREEKRRAKLKRKSKKNKQQQEPSAGTNTELSGITDTITKSTNERKQNAELPPWSRALSIESFPHLNSAYHKVSKIDDIYYIPHFLSAYHQDGMIEWLQTLSDNTSNDATAAVGRWNTMKYGKRRVALFDHKMELPPPLKQFAQILVQTGIFHDVAYPPNHVLINEYQPGQGILAHTDGPAYHAKTATLSLGGSSVLLNFCQRLKTKDIGVISTDNGNDNNKTQILLEGDGSLVVFAGNAYTNYTHSIDELIGTATAKEEASPKCVNAKAGTSVERGYRLSLTFRHHYV